MRNIESNTSWLLMAAHRAGMQISARLIIVTAGHSRERKRETDRERESARETERDVEGEAEVYLYR